MAFGAGHVQDMNNRIKQNRAQRPSKRPKFKEHYRQGIFSTEKKSPRPSFKTVASKELARIKHQIKTKAMNHRRVQLKRAVVLIVLIGLLMIPLVWLMKFKF